jgi:hypothetical protein
LLSDGGSLVELSPRDQEVVDRALLVPWARLIHDVKSGWSFALISAITDPMDMTVTTYMADTHFYATQADLATKLVFTMIKLKNSTSF